MRKAANKLTIVLVLLLVGLWYYGCGSGDILDENNLRYRTDVFFSDADEDEILTVDVDIIGDCNGDGNFTDPEFFTDLFANITISIDDETTPGIEMTGYKVSFRPLRSYDQSGNEITPPSVGTYLGDYDVIIPPLSEVSFFITCMEADLKLYIGSFLNAADWIFRYEVTIKMDFIDDYKVARDITVTRTLYFGAYNNC